MTGQRYEQIGQLFHQANELEEGQRRHFLDQACNGDDDLRQEVESLLGYQGQAEPFIESDAPH